MKNNKNKECHTLPNFTKSQSNANKNTVGRKNTINGSGRRKHRKLKNKRGTQEFSINVKLKCTKVKTNSGAQRSSNKETTVDGAQQHAML